MKMSELTGIVYRRDEHENGPELNMPSRAVKIPTRPQKLRSNKVHDQVLKMAQDGPITSLKVSSHLSISIGTAVQTLKTLQRKGQMRPGLIQKSPSASGRGHIVWVRA